MENSVCLLTLRKIQCVLISCAMLGVSAFSASASRRLADSPSASGKVTHERHSHAALCFRAKYSTACLTNKEPYSLCPFRCCRKPFPLSTDLYMHFHRPDCWTIILIALSHLHIDLCTASALRLLLSKHQYIDRPHKSRRLDSKKSTST